MNAILVAREALKTRDDLILHFDFSQFDGDTLRNLAANSAGKPQGQLIGGTPTTGRSGEGSGLHFNTNKQGIALDLEHPSLAKPFTLAIWVRLDQGAGRLGALFSSDGDGSQDLHLLVHRSGQLDFFAGRWLQFRSEKNSVQFGKWQLIAATWDASAEKWLLLQLRNLLIISILPQYWPQD